VPEDAGPRELVVTNPGPVRASIAVSVLGLQGPYAPSGAETLDVAAESTARVDLAEGLAGEAATIKLTSDQPVTGAVVSTSRRSGAQADLAVQSGAVPLVRTGASALATTTSGDGELVLTNAGTMDAAVSFEVLSFDGVVLRTDDVLLGPDSTATRRLTSPPPSYLVVRVPDGSAVVGGVVLTQAGGDVAGLATIPLTSPDVASRAPKTEADPGVGR
jgi:P pilus assembly chaperone PapD